MVDKASTEELVARLEQYYRDLNESLMVSAPMQDSGYLPELRKQFQTLRAECAAYLGEPPISPLEESNHAVATLITLKALTGQMAQWVRYKTGFQDYTFLVTGQDSYRRTSG